MKPSMDDIDFLPERIKAQRARKRRLIRQGYLLAIAVVALVVWAYFGSQRVAGAEGQLALLRECSAGVERQLALKGQLEHQLADLLIKERISKTLGSRVNVLDITHELERLLPASMFLKDLSLETIEYQGRFAGTGRVNLSRRATAGSGNTRTRAVKRVRLTITGLAPSDVSVANFIGQLSTSPIFEEVSMGYTKKTVYRKRIAREFKASCYIVR